MPILQVRDFPANMYEQLSKVATEQNRSISQQTITIMQQALMCENTAKSRRLAALDKTADLHITLTKDAPAPADLVREDRER